MWECPRAAPLCRYPTYARMISDGTIFWLGTISLSLPLVRRVAQYFDYGVHKHFDISMLVRPPTGYWLTIALFLMNGFCLLAAYPYASFGYLWLLVGSLYLLMALFAVLLVLLFRAGLSPVESNSRSFLNFRLQQQIPGSRQRSLIGSAPPELVLLPLWLLCWSW